VHHILSLLIGLALFAAGMFLRFKVNEKQFNRRNMAGVEEFSSYGKSVATQSAEKFLRLIAGFLIIVGIITFLLALR
jgi:uncharacterized membrane protein YidH (DUF202 family)